MEEVVEVVEVLEAEGQWEWEVFSKEVCQNYAQLEMVQRAVQWGDQPCGPQGPGLQPLAPPQVAPPHPPQPTSPLHQSTSAPTAPRSQTSPAPPVAAAAAPPQEAG